MKRKYYTSAESAELWGRWKKGEGLESIARALGRSHSSIFAHMWPSGGIRPPTPRAVAGGGRQCLDWIATAVSPYSRADAAWPRMPTWAQRDRPRSSTSLWQRDTAG